MNIQEMREYLNGFPMEDPEDPETVDNYLDRIGIADGPLDSVTTDVGDQVEEWAPAADLIMVSANQHDHPQIIEQNGNIELLELEVARLTEIITNMNNQMTEIQSQLQRRRR